MREWIEKAIRKALLEEVTCAPKAGLVTPYSRGAHTDMDYPLFLRSVEAIMPFFQRALLECEAGEGSPKAVFARLRAIGMEAEAAMLAETGGVNTHKGAIFSFLLLGEAALYCGKQKRLHVEDICSRGAAVARFALSDFEKGQGSKGMELYRRLGVQGIRGEAAAGFPTVQRQGLPAFQRAISLGESRGHGALSALTHLMAHCTDTNVLSRRGEEGLELLQREAKKLLPLRGEALAAGQERLNCLLVEQHISPGGCADLLAATLFLYEITALDHVLEDRERRYERRRALGEEKQGTVISVTLCAPYSYRTEDVYRPFFWDFVEKLEAFFKEKGLFIHFAERGSGGDGAYSLYVVQQGAEAVKRLCIEAEATLSGGRLFDVDVMAASGVCLGRKDVHFPPRRCLVCDGEAAPCVAGKRHSRAEIAHAVEALLQKCGDRNAGVGNI